MSIYTWLWLGIGVCALILEGVALFNSRQGDTLSEHVWAWLGIPAYDWIAARRRNVQGDAAESFVAPVWTLRVARLALITFMVWLTLHFTTGGWV